MCHHSCHLSPGVTPQPLQVYEQDYQFMDLGVAVRRGRLIKCKVCNSKGATLGCHVATCKNSAHLPCARFKKWLMEVRACLCIIAPFHTGHLASSIYSMRICAAVLLRKLGPTMQATVPILCYRTLAMSMLCSHY